MEETRKTGRALGVSIGSATLVMLFATVCLTIFAVMTLVTANHEWKLAQKSADAVTAYYEADAKATEIFQQLHTACCLLLDGVELDGVTLSETDGVLSYAVPVDDMQNLQVELVWQEAGGWEICSWRVVQTGQWEADETLDVWSGE